MKISVTYVAHSSILLNPTTVLSKLHTVSTESSLTSTNKFTQAASSIHNQFVKDCGWDNT